jgi:hypothetical protein
MGVPSMINVRDLISQLEKIHDKNLLVVTYNGNGDFMYLPGPPKVIHVRNKRDEVLEKVHDSHDEAFPVVEV